MENAIKLGDIVKINENYADYSDMFDIEFHVMGVMTFPDGHAEYKIFDGDNEYEGILDEELIKINKSQICEHNFQIAKKDFYKPDGGQNMFGPTYDQTKTYSTLFCTKCGTTKEIVTS